MTTESKTRRDTLSFEPAARAGWDDRDANDAGLEHGDLDAARIPVTTTLVERFFYALAFALFGDPAMYDRGDC